MVLQNFTVIYLLTYSIKPHTLLSHCGSPKQYLAHNFSLRVKILLDILLDCLENDYYFLSLKLTLSFSVLVSVWWNSVYMVTWCFSVSCQLQDHHPVHRQSVWAIPPRWEWAKPKTHSGQQGALLLLLHISIWTWVNKHTVAQTPTVSWRWCYLYPAVVYSDLFHYIQV